MAIIKRIVCLANSRKLHGRCIAGRELVGGKPVGWIRPVSDREREEVSEYERQYEDGSDPILLDVIEVPLAEPRPKGYQQENWLLDPAQYWVKMGRFAWNDLTHLADTRGPLWLNVHHTYNGLNDEIPLEQAQAIRSSLKLIHVDGVELHVFRTGGVFGNPKRRVQARFQFAGDDYRLWVTDPVIERDYLAQGDGVYTLKYCYLTISLGEPYNGNCYKLVAAVIQKGFGTS
ncbi:MAG: hypothetical protein KF814_00485 [Nitrospiraceae bacterium]|nr:hypothetical protein [Nitrospiraceae bacterium]